MLRPNVSAVSLASAVFAAIGLGLSACTAAPTSVVLPAHEQTADVVGLDVGDPQPGNYSRDAFGQRWSDDVAVEGGHNGCDTRNDVLRRDLDQLVVKDNTQGCVAYAGVLHDPYTGQDYRFQRGADGNAKDIHIDHVVSLANAWATGAQQWDAQKRQNFANDPQNLQTTTAAANKAKGAADASQWLPPNMAYQCEYVQRQIAVKRAYGLFVTVDEKAAMERVLAHCD